MSINLRIYEKELTVLIVVTIKFTFDFAINPLKTMEQNLNPDVKAGYDVVLYNVHTGDFLDNAIKQSGILNKPMHIFTFAFKNKPLLYLK